MNINKAVISLILSLVNLLLIMVLFFILYNNGNLENAIKHSKPKPPAVLESSKNNEVIPPMPVDSNLDSNKK